MTHRFKQFARWAFQICGEGIALCVRCLGFSMRGVKPESHPINELVLEDSKAAAGGERQASPSIDGIRADHRVRYEFALQFIQQSAKILDVACGVGYGSYIIANQSKCKSIMAVDNSEDAITYARKYYSSPRIEYRLGDCLTIYLELECFDIVVCFETIEHIKNDIHLLMKFHGALKPQGMLLCSTPNQEKIPFSYNTHPFHIKHYTNEEFKKLLAEVSSHS